MASCALLFPGQGSHFDGMEETLIALDAAGVRRYVELGPGELLTGMVRRTVVTA